LVDADAIYPKRMASAKHPSRVLYCKGNTELLHDASVAVVGTRKPSPEGVKRARNITRALVRAGYTIASGLAAGIDREAHVTAIREKGKTFAVLGTPIHKKYPSENEDLFKKIAAEHLLVSQWPLLSKTARWFFPERNRTMSALSTATVIVEAGETSGTLTQAKAALAQGRKALILDSCFGVGLTWPERLVAKGAIRISDERELLAAIAID